MNRTLKWLVAGFVVYSLLTTTERKVRSMIDRKAFLTEMGPIARRILSEYSIQPLITVVQAAHESRWGDSLLARDAKNLFGMTGENWAVFKDGTWTSKDADKPIAEYQKRQVYVVNTNEEINGKNILVRRPFRKYADWYHSARDWAVSISTNPRYRSAYEAAKSGDIKKFAEEVQKAGYATDSKYAAKLIQLGADPIFANA